MGLAGQLFIDARGAPRRRIEGDATLRDPQARPIDVEVVDLSETGFRVTSPAELAIDARVSLGFGGWGAQPAQVVRRDGNSYGCAFLTALAPGEIERARAAATVAEGGFPDRYVPAAIEADRGLSLRARAATIVGLAAASWVLVGATAWIALA